MLNKKQIMAGPLYVSQTNIKVDQTVLIAKSLATQH